MMKLEKSMNFLEENKKRSLRDRMICDGELELIEKYISSDNSLGCALAIGACVKHKLVTEIIEKALLNLTNSNAREFCVSISDLANASMDLLEIRKYQGMSESVKELIKSQFDFVG